MAPQIGKTYKGSVYNVHRRTRIRGTLNDREMVSIYNKKDYVHMPGIGRYRTGQNAAVMGYLTRSGIPTTFIRRANTLSTECWMGEMIKLEIVWRHCFMGSWLKRNPGKAPGWHDRPEVELHHKQTLVLGPYGPPRLVDGNNVGELREGEVAYADPFLKEVDGRWLVYDAYQEVRPDNALCVLDQGPVTPELAAQCVALAYGVGDILSSAIGKLDAYAAGIDDAHRVRLGDFKIEACLRFKDSALVVGDVFTLDNCRLLKDGRWEKKEDHLSKEVRRKAGTVEETLEAYRKGHKLLQQLDDL